MKVTTDACLFGAVIANEAYNNNYGPRVLDIGTGTGLLSLMFAQKKPEVKIDGVEIDEAAAMQATSNIAASVFTQQISVQKEDIKTFTPGILYDFVFTNPPFFENELRSMQDGRNTALHDASLTLTDLMKNINRLLNPTGQFSILLPFQRTAYFIQQAELFQWNCFKQINIRQSEKHDFFRTILFFCKHQTNKQTDELLIKEHNDYSDSFKKLLMDYYLYL
jgi:tRNA1Val (adenine37-N6)-methyltransferase